MLSEMNLLDMCLQESLRIHPPGQRSVHILGNQGWIQEDWKENKLRPTGHQTKIYQFLDSWFFMCVAPNLSTYLLTHSWGNFDSPFFQ